ncbi:sigma 54-interacting transcriptional regulator [Clostridiaceae bacterium 35-E11]
MKDNTLRKFLDNNTKTSNKNKQLDHSSQLGKVFFDMLSCMILEAQIMVLLIDDAYRIKSIFSNDEKKYDCFTDRRLLLKDCMCEQSLLLETYEHTNIYAYISRLFSYHCHKYRFVIIALKEEEQKHKLLIEKLNKAMTRCIAYHNHTYASYENLLKYLDAIDDGISACDSSGTLQYINKSACSMIEGEREELLHQRIDVLTSNAILSQVIKNKKAYMDFEYFLQYKNKTFHLMNSAYPVYDENKKLIGAIDIFKRIKRSMKVANELAGYEAVYRFENFIGKSKVFQERIDLARKFAQSNKNILIIGESGTGKELFAQAIHNFSRRGNGPFVAINCASFPKDLFDSELFGYDEGAFTGARKGGKVGKFELANGGTLFLDEIGEMSIHLQAKLLRVLETRSISRIGSNKKIDVDVRIIAATNRNLEQMVKNNNFRGDLYYRLRVLYLNLPPLIERNEDIIELTNYFIDKFSKDANKRIKGIDEEAKHLLKSYRWPGNIRELENIIALSLFFCEGQYITKEDLIRAGLKNMDNHFQNQEKNVSKLSDINKELILQTLENTNGNKRKAAQILGISRNTIYRTLKKYNEESK